MNTGCCNDEANWHDARRQLLCEPTVIKVDHTLHELATRVAKSMLECVGRKAKDLLLGASGNGALYSKRRANPKHGKTVGVMRVEFESYSDGSTSVDDIVAVSGQRMNQWRPAPGLTVLANQEVTWRDKFRSLRVQLAPFAAAAAMRAYKMASCRLFDTIPVSKRLRFAEEFVIREQNFVKSAAAFEGNSSREDMLDCAGRILREQGCNPEQVNMEKNKLTMFMADDRRKVFLPNGTNDEPLAGSPLYEMYISTSDLQETARKSVLTIIMNAFQKRQSQPPMDVDRRLDDFLNEFKRSPPAERCDLRERFIYSLIPDFDPRAQQCFNQYGTVFEVAAGVHETSSRPGFSEAIADAHVQCAEDNALAAVIEICRDQNVFVKGIQWYSCKIVGGGDASRGFERVEHFSLCGFCDVAFEGRCRAINFMARKSVLATYEG